MHGADPHELMGKTVLHLASWWGHVDMIQVCMCACVSVCMNLCTYVCVCLSMSLYVCVCLPVWLFVSMCLSVCMFECVRFACARVHSCVVVVYAVVYVHVLEYVCMFMCARVCVHSCVVCVMYV